MTNTIRLQGTKDKHFRGHARYVVSYDHAAGSKDRYYVWLLNSKDPVTLGRELPLEYCRSLIARYEGYFASEALSGRPYYGSRRQALKALQGVKKELLLKGPGLSKTFAKQVARAGKAKPNFRGALVR